MRQVWKKWLGGGIAFFIGLLLLLMLWPMRQMETNPNGAIAADADSSNLDPRAATITLSHGHQTETVYILLHGVTNYPVQFLDLGQMLFAKGSNVIIPRMPYHGHKDRMTRAHQFFGAEPMMHTVNLTINEAKSMGKKVRIMGLSVNGISAAWVAQNRADVDKVVILAPPFSPPGLPDWLIGPVARLFYRLPNFFVWWDPKLRENLAPESLTYPRFSTHALASILLLGLEIFDQARQIAPKSRNIIMVTSENDIAINLHRVDELVALWKLSAPNRVIHYRFPKEWNVPHDLIDPRQPDQQVDRVYPVLLELLENTESAQPASLPSSIP